MLSNTQARRRARHAVLKVDDALRAEIGDRAWAELVIEDLPWPNQDWMIRGRADGTWKSR